MKTITNALCICLMLFLSFSGNAQVVRCSTTEHEAELLKINPKREKQRAQYEQLMQHHMQTSVNRGGQATITIPVVVHVVYGSPQQNISVAQIQSQIEVLNEDFAKLNADTVNIPVAFRPMAAATTLQFCLAQQDPNGLPTTGIERRSTTVTSFSTNDNIKDSATGGLDAWDPSMYFNIWVGRLSNGILGYAEFPTGSLSNTFGIVIDYRYFGRTGTATAPFNKGRTATHEVGHCFNLHHIWGNDGSACNGTDYVTDTPNQGGENYGCPSYPLTDNCTATNPGVMFMNYMDYVDDACMHFFTTGQANRINAIINNAPYNALATSIGCQAPATAGDDAGISSIITPAATNCSGTFTPEVVLHNFGTNALTSASITYSIDGGTPVTYIWTGSIASSASANVSLPVANATAGAHNFTVYSSFPNGQTDADQSNDTLSVAFSISGGATGLALPYSEGFEGVFPAAGMYVINPDVLDTWQQTSLAAKTGTMSVMMDNFDYDASGEIDEIILPALDLTSGSTASTTPYLTFEVAYQLYTSPTANPNYSDTLRVLVSVDCGTTYAQVYQKQSTQLTTTTPAFSTIEFVPGSTQWRKDSVSLGSFETFNSVLVKFMHTTDYENNLYLDDINIQQYTNTGIDKVSNQSISIFPNPVTETLTIQINEEARVEIYNVSGQVVFDSVSPLAKSAQKIDVAGFTNGVYTIKATSANSVYTGKFVKK